MSSIHRVAITGGLGALGQSVERLALAAGLEVVSIDRVTGGQPVPLGVERRQVDMTDYDAFSAAIAGCDALVHTAAHIGPRLLPAHVVHNENVTSSYNALSASAEAGIDRVCMASSVNAVGGVYSLATPFSYFPLDESHPSFTDDPYGSSKWEAEFQAEAIARRYPSMSIASLRFHAIQGREAQTELYARDDVRGRTNLWGYSPPEQCAQVCLDSLIADFSGAEVFYCVADEAASDIDSSTLAQQYFPGVPVRGEFSGHASFFDSSKARRVLGWGVDRGATDHR